LSPEAPLQRLQDVGIAAAMRDSSWLYPVVETTHILGFIVLVGTVVMFDLRLLGFSRRISVRLLASHLLPWSLAALLLIVPAGLLMFLAEAEALVSNPAFVLKMMLLLLAAGNALLFHAGAFRSAAAWDSNVSAPRAAKVHAVLSMMLWTAIVACGRAIAYV
jgi:hypothetical protein